MISWKEDKNVIVNSFFIIFFTFVILVVVWLRPSDGQTYQTFVAMLSGFGGALLMDMKTVKTPPTGSSTIVTQVDTIEKIEGDKHV